MAIIDSKNTWLFQPKYGSTMD